MPHTACTAHLAASLLYDVLLHVQKYITLGHVSAKTDAFAFGTAHSSNKCKTDRKCTSDWFDREHSHVRDVL